MQTTIFDLGDWRAMYTMKTASNCIVWDDKITALYYENCQIIVIAYCINSLVYLLHDIFYR